MAYIGMLIGYSLVVCWMLARHDRLEKRSLEMMAKYDLQIGYIKSNIQRLEQRLNDKLPVTGKSKWDGFKKKD